MAGLLGTRLSRLERKLGVGAPVHDDDGDEAEAVRAWWDEIRAMRLEIKLGRAPTPEELVVELAREEDVGAMRRALCKQWFVIRNGREPGAAELDAAVRAHEAELAADAAKFQELPPEQRPRESAAGREQLRRFFATELERHRRQRAGAA